MTLTKCSYFLYVYFYHLRTCSGVSVASTLQCRFSIVFTHCREVCHAMLWSSDSIKFISIFLKIDQMVQQQ